MKRYLLALLILLYNFSALSQQYKFAIDKYQPTSSNIAERKKFREMRFGMFIHWGIYSILGDGEWVMHTEKIPYDSYKKLAGFFNPQAFDAREWVSIAKRAGMKYITITSRHHDGFSMFDTKASSYNIVQATPYKKDPLMALAKECQRQGIELHFYYSLLDWGRTDYGFGKPIENGHPQGADWLHYISFMKQQLTELITKYPAVKGIWFDGHWERPEVNWYYNEIYALIHHLNPAILIGNNHHMAPLPGEDFQMFEKDLPGENTAGFNKNSIIGTLPLETCETINESWGFNINDRKYKSVKQIISYLVNAAGRNANFLLNIGPMPNGKIQQEFIDTLAQVGKWMKINGESIYNTTSNSISIQPWGIITSKPHVLYLHVLRSTDQINLTLDKKVHEIDQLSNGNKIDYKSDNGLLIISLKNIKVDPIDTVIKLISD